MRAGPADSVSALSVRPWLGILGLLCGAFISTLTGRLSSFGLADIRGAMHAGFDEGAWITTAQSCGQMLMGPLSVWLGAVFGPRRVLVSAALVFTVTAVLTPLAPNLPLLLALQAISGLATGTFIPLTIVFVARDLPPRYVGFGVAAYALNLELSLNIPATLEGWFADHLSWHWIFWQCVPLALLMAWCIHRGVPKQPMNAGLLRDADWFGIASLSLGLTVIYAALDQGNRLDWLNSGLVTGLLAGGFGLLLAFGVHERLVAAPWINVGFLFRSRLPLLMLLVASLRLAISSSALLLPQFLSSVQGFRSIQTGPALLAIAVPQLAIAPLTGLLLRHLDARVMLVAGFSLVAGACWLVALGLTGSWAAADFLPSEGLQAVGQTFAASSVVFLVIVNIKPADALTFGAMIQVARLLGGELGTAGISTMLRVREQVASNLLGLHVQAGPLLTERLQHYVVSMQARALGLAEAELRATGILSAAVRLQATVQAFLDSYAVVGLLMMGALFFVALLGPAPDHPALPERLRRQ